ncbi:hypothetical protein EON80_22235 [bacterium]|nr:MAG: hypothetical protein EON80_22235 [bacterium]
MMNWQPWQWWIDVEAGTKPRKERFTWPLKRERILWDAFVLPVPGRDFSYVLLHKVESDDLFCVCDSGGDIAETTLTNVSDAFSVQVVYSKAFNNRNLARLFFLSDCGQLRERGEATDKIVVVSPNGTCQWSAWPDTRHNCASFRLFAGEGLSAFIHRPAIQIWQTLQDALKDPRSDATFACEWSAKTEEQRSDMVWNWPSDKRQGVRDEFQSWLQCFLWHEDSLWQEHKYWDLSVPNPNDIWLYSKEGYRHVISSELRQAIEQLWHRYEPFHNETLKYWCASDWKQNTIEAFHVEVSEPTAHERIEATLRWREWQEQTQ